MGRSPLPFDPIKEAQRHWEKRWSAGDAMAAATSVMRVQQIVLSRVDEALRPLGLNFARYEVLVLLSFTRRQSIPLGKMSSRLMIHPTSVTNLVDRLEMAGLVRRVPHPNDRRTTLAELTDEGRQALHAATKRVTAIRFGMGDLTDEELARLTTMLGEVRLSTGDFRPADASAVPNRNSPQPFPVVTKRTVTMHSATSSG